MQAINGELIDIVDEATPLVANEKGSSFGRAWSWIKEKATPANIIKVVVGTASTVSLATLGYFAARELVPSVQYVFPSLHGYGIGMGLTAPLFLYSVLPDSAGTPLADGISRWSFELFYAAAQFYSKAGLGLWDRQNPPVIIKKVATVAFSVLASAFTLMTFRSFYPLFSSETEQVASAPTAPLSIFLEAGTREDKQLFLEQAVKTVVGSTLLGLCKGGLILTSEVEDCAYYMLGHTAGVLACRTYLLLKDKGIIAGIQNRKLQLLVERIGGIAELLAFGAFFAWNTDPSYLLSGATAGAAKLAILAKFETLAANDEKVGPLQFRRIDNVAKAIFLTAAIGWNAASVILNPQAIGPIIDLVGLTAASALSYPLTRYLAKKFSPGANSNLFNTFRFYFVNHQEALILPYMFLDISKDPENWKGITKRIISSLSFGLSVGNNRALQGIRSYRTPAPVADLAQMFSWYVLYGDKLAV